MRHHAPFLTYLHIFMVLLYFVSLWFSPLQLPFPYAYDNQQSVVKPTFNLTPQFLSHRSSHKREDGVRAVSFFFFLSLDPPSSRSLLYSLSLWQSFCQFHLPLHLRFTPTPLNYAAERASRLLM